jgi:hypothetical protein
MGNPARSTRIGVVVVAIFTATALVLGIQAPSSLAEESGAPPPASSTAPNCDNPPDYATISSAECDRFVSLWTPRVTNQQWLEDYIALPSLPADIQAEGFHSIDKPTQGWLVTVLVEHLIQLHGAHGNDPGVEPSPADLQRIQGLDALIIFGKDELNQLKARAQEKPDLGAPRVHGPTALQPLVDQLAHIDTTNRAAAQQSPTQTNAVVAQTPPDPAAVSDALNTLEPRSTPIHLDVPPIGHIHGSIDPNALISIIIGALGASPVQSLLTLVSALLTAVANIEQVLFAVPGLSVLGGLTYRVCAEGPTLPLACTVNLPVGTPIPTDANGDHVADVLATLTPVVSTPTPQVVSLIPPIVKTVTNPDVGFKFQVKRLFPGVGPLPSHVFAVYDPPTINKRVEYGYDGRASTLADDTTSTATLKNVLNAIRGDVEVVAQVTHKNPGTSEALTAAIKTLVPATKVGQLPTEVDPTAAAINFSPVPTTLTADAHLQHTLKDQDTVTLDTSIPSTVNALLTQDMNAAAPKSHREFTALIDKLPTHVAVDLLHQGANQVITYGANAGVAHVHVSQKSIDDITHSGSYTQNDADVLGLPSAIKLTLSGAQDILYEASDVIPQASFVTQTNKDSVLQSEITGIAHGIPKTIHVNNTTNPDGSVITYDSDTKLVDIGLGMYDKAQDETTLVATAQSLPTHAQLTQTKSTGATDYTSNGPIAKIAATLTRGGGSFIPLPGVDHATVRKSGNGLGLDFVISGVKAAHADPSEKATYSLTMDPGNQPFEGLAELDAPNRLAEVHISNLPPTITVTLDPANGKATYAAQSVISSVDATYKQLDSGQQAVVGLTNVPKNITATWATGGASPSITYSADSRLGSLSAFYQEAPGATTFFGKVSDLPLFMKISGVDPITFDARSAPAAASASDHIGQILLQYSSDGTLVTVPDANDHLYLSALTAATKAELVYSGLSFASVNTANEELHAQLKNVAARRFDAQVDTDNLSLTAFIDKVPDDVRVDMVGENIQYHAQGPIHEISALVTRSSGDVISADVFDIPSSIELALDSAASTVDWIASDVTGSIGVTAHLVPATTGIAGRNIDAALTISGIPRTWDASYGSGHVLFEGTSGAIGAIQASFTNHGSFTGFGPGVDGLSAVFNQASGDLDAYMHISALQKAEFQKLAPTGSGSAGGFDANLNMGNGSPFHLNGLVTLADTTRASVVGTIDHLPTIAHVNAIDGHITYNGNSNPTLTLDAAYGKTAAINATPPAPNVQGVSVRDGASGADKAIKAHIFLTGLPTGIDFNSVAGTYQVTGYNPTINTLTIDAALSHFVSTPAKILVTQNIDNLGSPVNFTFGPFTTGVNNDGAKTMHAVYTASRQLGQFTADATYGDNVAHAEVSNIPQTFNLDTIFGDSTKNITITMHNAITKIVANVRTVFDNSGFTAGATLTNVPKTVNLNIAPDSGSSSGSQVTTPMFTYTGDTSGLGITAFMNADALGPAHNAFLQLNNTNLGRIVTSNLSGTQLDLTSTPATGSFTLIAGAHFTFGPFDLGFSAAEGVVQNTGDLSIDFNLAKLTIGFTNMSSLTLKLGVSTAILGTYGTFTFDEDSDTHLTLHDDLKLHCGGCAFGFDVDVHLIDNFAIENADLGNLIGSWHLAKNENGHWYSQDLVLRPCSFDPTESVHFNINMTPVPYSNVAGSGFTVSSSDSPNGWIVTPNPWGVLPGFVMDIVAYFTTPESHDLGVSFSCE